VTDIIADKVGPTVVDAGADTAGDEADYLVGDKPADTLID
jgi:hypothetical protein